MEMDDRQYMVFLQGQIDFGQGLPYGASHQVYNVNYTNDLHDAWQRGWDFANEKQSIYGQESDYGIEKSVPRRV